MKNLVLLTYFLFIVLCTYAQPAKVKGFIKGYTQPKIYMTILNGSKLLKDSAIVTDGYFNFAIDVQEPLVARLITRDPSKRITDQTTHFTSFAPVIQLFLAPKTETSLTGDYLEWPIVNISGSLANQLQTNYYLNNTSTILQEEKAFKESIAQKNANDPLKAKMIDSIRLKHTITNTNAYAQLAKENPNSLLNAFYIYESLPFSTDELILEKTIACFSTALKNGVYGLAIQKRYNELSESGIGTVVKNFKVNGKDSLININAYRGKYVLLDFGAHGVFHVEKAIRNSKSYMLPTRIKVLKLLPLHLKEAKLHNKIGSRQ